MILKIPFEKFWINNIVIWHFQNFDSNIFTREIEINNNCSNSYQCGFEVFETFSIANWAFFYVDEITDKWDRPRVWLTFFWTARSKIVTVSTLTPTVTLSEIVVSIFLTTFSTSRVFPGTFLFVGQNALITQ